MKKHGHTVDIWTLLADLKINKSWDNNLLSLVRIVSPIEEVNSIVPQRECCFSVSVHRPWCCNRSNDRPPVNPLLPAV